MHTSGIFKLLAKLIKRMYYIYYYELTQGCTCYLQKFCLYYYHHHHRVCVYTYIYSQFLSAICLCCSNILLTEMHKIIARASMSQLHANTAVQLSSFTSSVYTRMFSILYSSNALFLQFVWQAVYRIIAILAR